MLLYNQFKGNNKIKKNKSEGEKNDDEVEKRNAMLYVGALL